MMTHFSLLPHDSSSHTLLNPPSPAYSKVTIRRAFIVWLHCGMHNEFRNVCNYFHHLESLEEKLSTEDRAASRRHEFNLLATIPPSSKFLCEYFPNQYRHSKNSKVNIKGLLEFTVEDCVFKLEGFHDMKILKGATTKDIIKTSQMIKQYCISHSITLRKLLSEFQNFAKKAKLYNSVDNIAMYITNNNVKDELVTWNNTPKSFSFLDEDEDAIPEIEWVDYVKSSNKEACRDVQSPIIKAEDHTFNADRNANEIKILINEYRRNELLNMIPNCQNVLKAKLSKMKKPKPG